MSNSTHFIIKPQRGHRSHVIIMSICYVKYNIFLNTVNQLFILCIYKSYYPNTNYIHYRFNTDIMSLSCTLNITTVANYSCGNNYNYF